MISITHCSHFKLNIMKKIFITLAAAILTAGAASAQDMQQATDTYNNGAMALQTGDNAGALNYFKQALTMAEACGEEGTEMVGKCKDIIPNVELSIAKDLIKSEQYDEAVAQLGQAISSAKEYANADVEAEATELIPQVYMAQANSLLNAKNYDGAAAAYQKIIDSDPENGQAYLRLGAALSAGGKVAEAEAAFTSAMQKGQEAQAVKQLSNMYLKLALSDLKAKKYEESVAHALKSNEYQESATAMQIAGQASTALGKNADALKYTESYIALSPNARNINDMYYTAAVLAQQLGENEKACGYYQKVTGDAKYGATAKQQITALKCN